MSGSGTPATARKRPAEHQIWSNEEAYNPEAGHGDIRQGSWIAVADWNKLPDAKALSEVHYPVRVLERVSDKKVRIQYAGFEAVAGQRPFEIDLGDLRVCTARTSSFLVDFCRENPRQPIPGIFLTAKHVSAILNNIKSELGPRNKSSNPSYSFKETHPYYNCKGIEVAHWSGKYGKHGAEGHGQLTYLDTHPGENKFFDGVCERGKVHHGRMTTRDGSVYDGTFIHEKVHGKGQWTSPAGDVYVGEFYEGLRHGKGRLTETTGRIYTGGWVLGKETGRGVVEKDGERYEGECLNGMHHGDGRCATCGRARESVESRNWSTDCVS